MSCTLVSDGLWQASLWGWERTCLTFLFNCKFDLNYRPLFYHPLVSSGVFLTQSQWAQWLCFLRKRLSCSVLSRWHHFTNQQKLRTTENLLLLRKWKCCNRKGRQNHLHSVLPSLDGGDEHTEEEQGDGMLACNPGTLKSLWCHLIIQSESGVWSAA